MLAGTKVTRNGSFGPKAERIGPILRKHMKAEKWKQNTNIYFKKIVYKNILQCLKIVSRDSIEPFMPGLEIAQIGKRWKRKNKKDNPRVFLVLPDGLGHLGSSWVILGHLGSSWVREHHQQAAVTSEWLRKSLESRSSPWHNLNIMTQLHMSADWPTDLEEYGFCLWNFHNGQWNAVFSTTWSIYVQSSFKAAELGQIHLRLFQTHPKPKSDA